MQTKLIVSLCLSLIFSAQTHAFASTTDSKSDAPFNSKKLVLDAVAAALDDNRTKLLKIYDYDLLSQISTADVSNALIEDMIKRAYASALDLSKKKKYTEAAKKLETVFDLSDNLISASRKTNSGERAPDCWLKSWKEAKLSQPIYIAALNDYGFYLQKCDQNSEAVRILQAVINNAPQREVAYLNLADSLWQLDRKDEAAPYFEKYKEMMKSENKAGSVPKHVETVLSLHPALRPAKTETSDKPTAHIDFGPYMADLQRRIKEKWHPIKSNVSKFAVVDFDVSKSGAVSNVEITEGGPDDAFNKTALATIRDAVLAPLPANATESVRIRFNFDYNVLDNEETKKIKSLQEIAAKSNTPENHIELGRELEKAGNLSAAQSEYYKALALDPKNTDAKKLVEASDQKVSAMQKMLAGYGKQNGKGNKAFLPQLMLNNDGVHALQKKGEYDPAIQKFNQALMLQPGYKLARDNLAISFNNRGLAERKDYILALKDFHRAACLNPEDPTVEKNIETLLSTRGKSSNSFEALKEVADDSYKNKDYVGALVEYRRALKVKDDLNTQQRILELQKEILSTSTKISDFTGP